MPMRAGSSRCSSASTPPTSSTRATDRRPLFVGSGYTDDLFPVDEAVEFVNRAKRLYPGLPVSMFLGDYGHQRAANKSLQRERLIIGIRHWFHRYVKAKKQIKGKGTKKRKGAKTAGSAKRGKDLTGVRAFTQTCPRGAPSSRVDVRQDLRRPREGRGATQLAGRANHQVQRRRSPGLR